MDSPWRVKADGPGAGDVNLTSTTPFDELVVGEGATAWFHLERMDYNSWWMRVGRVHFDIVVQADGSATIHHRTIGKLEDTE